MTLLETLEYFLTETAADMDSLSLEIREETNYTENNIDYLTGHTHQNLDFNIGDCRMLCNAVGYENELEPKILEIEV